MSDTPLRLVFAGTPAFAAAHLEALIDSPHEIVAVYTQPDRPAGRGKKVQESAVKVLAAEHGLPIRQPASLRPDSEPRALAALQPDAMVVVAYGLILPRAILDTPRLGCLNVHASLLPRWRGAAPIQRAIEAGDAETGITIMQMDAGLDTGDMLAVASCPITAATTSAALQDRLAGLGAPLLRQVLDQLVSHQRGATPQPEDGVTYAHKIHKAEAEIDWSQDAASLQRRVRAFNPAPVCFSWLGGERLRIWEAQLLPVDQDGIPLGGIPLGGTPLGGTPLGGTSLGGTPPGGIVAADRHGILVQCGEGQLCITRLQLPGGKPLTAEQVLNSRADGFAPGTRLGAPAPG